MIDSQSNLYYYIIVRITKDPEERRIEIIKAALTLFIKKGFSKTTVSEIVESINVAQGTFYYYFDSKEKVLEAIVEVYVDRIKNSIQPIMQNSNLNALQKLEQISQAQLNINKQMNNNIHRIKGGDIHERIIRILVKKFVPIQAEVIEQGIHEGLLKSQYPLEITEIFMVAGNILFDPGIFQWSDSELEKRVNILIQLMEKAFEAKEGSFNFYKTLMMSGRGKASEKI